MPRTEQYSLIAGERTSTSTVANPADVIRSLVGSQSVIERSAALEAFHQLRENVPIIHAAIINRRILEGTPVFESDDEGLVEALNDLAAEIPFGHLGGNATMRGIYQLMHILSSAADEYGFTGYEIQLEPNGRAIKRVALPSPKLLSIIRNPREPEYHVRYTDSLTAKSGVRVDDSPLWGFHAFGGSVDSVWPPPLTWPLMQNGAIQVRAFNAVAIQWWRYADPALLFTIEYDKDAEPANITVKSEDPEIEDFELPESLSRLMDAVTSSMKDRVSGHSSDAYGSAVGGKFDIHTIGDVDTTLARYWADHMRYLDAQVVQLSQTPSWMYPHLSSADGLNSSKSSNEGLIASVAASRRQVDRNRIIKRILDLALTIQGDSRYVGKYTIDHDSASIIDDKAEAEAAKTAAEAEATLIENTLSQFDADGKRLFQGDALEYYTKNTTAR